jgi:uncharacterized protein YqhQ
MANQMKRVVKSLRGALPLLAEGSVLVGGQAVIEGVLMRLPSSYAVAVRDAKGNIRVKKERTPETAKGKFGNLPFIRGSVILFKSLMLGISALNWSAEVSMEEDEAPAPKEAGSPAVKKASSLALAATVAFSLLAGVALFFYVPLLLTQWLARTAAFAQTSIGFNLIDGAIRVVFFLVYLAAISAMKDIRRVFGYHGAEHKVVHASEAREELTVDNARAKSRLHPRCGTSFLLFVMVVSILVFSIVPNAWPFWTKALSRIVLLPLIAGISYELIRLTGKFPRFWPFRPLIWPGLGLQLLTTRQPDDSMLEVSLRALSEAKALAEDSAAAT